MKTDKVKNVTIYCYVVCGWIQKIVTEISYLQKLSREVGESEYQSFIS